MRSIVFPVIVALCTSALGCLPNPQSEWVTSEGSVQRSTVSDATFRPADVTLCEELWACANDDDDDDFPTTTTTTSHVHVAHPHVGHHGITHVAHFGGGHSGRSRR